MEREGAIERLEGQGTEREGEFGPRLFGGMRSAAVFAGYERRGMRRGERFARLGGGGMGLVELVGLFDN
jgi:hypothetical protein